MSDYVVVTVVRSRTGAIESRCIYLMYCCCWGWWWGYCRDFRSKQVDASQIKWSRFKFLIGFYLRHPFHRVQWYWLSYGITAVFGRWQSKELTLVCNDYLLLFQIEVYLCKFTNTLQLWLKTQIWLSLMWSRQNQETSLLPMELKCKFIKLSSSPSSPDHYPVLSHLVLVLSLPPRPKKRDRDKH